MLQNIFLLNNTAKVSNSKKYPSLDGLRGVSIILVVLFHFNIGNYGVLGVNVFFIISGFLITVINLKEYSKTGTIALKAFYKRRALRILPLLYLYITTLLVLDHIFHLDIAPINIFAAFAFLMDFSYFRIHGFTWFTGHLWSLAVEEQFYLFIPLIFKVNYKVFIMTILFLIFVLPFICLLQNYWPAINQGIPYYITHFFIKFQSIAVGCLIAVLAFNGWLTIEQKFLTSLILNIGAIVILCYVNYDPFYSIEAVFTNLFIAVVIAYLLITNITKNNSLLYKVLNTKPLTFIGIISYSLYMWNPLFTSYEKKLPLLFNQGCLSAVVLFSLAVLSYFFYEKQFLKLKKKIKNRNNIAKAHA